MRIAGIRKTSLFDSVGINYTIFTQGCPHACEGCHNPSTWDTEGGYEITLDELKADISSLQLIQGITFSGGEPLEQYGDVFSLAMWAHSQELQTTLYTGYRYNGLVWGLHEFYAKDKHIHLLPEHMDYLDYVIDGAFDISKKTLEMPFVGSSNQRILKLGRDY